MINTYLYLNRPIQGITKQNKSFGMNISFASYMTSNYIWIPSHENNVCQYNPKTMLNT